MKRSFHDGYTFQTVFYALFNTFWRVFKVKVICGCVERELSYYLGCYNILREHLHSEEEVEDYFLTNPGSTEVKRVCIFDYDEAPGLKKRYIPFNYYVIGMTDDPFLKVEDTTAYTLINKSSSMLNVINTIEEILDEVLYRQLGDFPLYVGVQRKELSTPSGILPLLDTEWRVLKYLAQNKGRAIPGEELAHHVFYAGKEDELHIRLVKLLQVYICNLRKKMELLYPLPVLTIHKRTYLILDNAQKSIEEKFLFFKTHFHVTGTDELRKKCEDLYQELTMHIAQESLKELQTADDVKSKTKRYEWLRRNLNIKENFSLSRLRTAIQKIRFKVPHKIQQACNAIDALEFKE